MLYVMSQFHPIPTSTGYFCKAYCGITSASVLNHNAVVPLQLQRSAALGQTHTYSTFIRSALFCDVTRYRVVIVYRRFGTTYRSRLRASKSPRRNSPEERRFINRLVVHPCPIYRRIIPQWRAEPACSRPRQQLCHKDASTSKLAKLFITSTGCEHFAILNVFMSVKIGRHVRGTLQAGTAVLHCTRVKGASGCEGFRVIPRILRVEMFATSHLTLNTQQFYVLPTQRVYVFCVDLRTNSDYFPIQH
jgi:hypothetical protein